MYSTNIYSVFLVAVSGSTYSYTVGIDRVDASLLCNPDDDGIFLGNLMWSIENGGMLRNPINMSEWSNTLAQQAYQLNCPSAGSEFTVTVNINGESICRVCIVAILHYLFITPYYECVLYMYLFVEAPPNLGTTP